MPYKDIERNYLSEKLKNGKKRIGNVFIYRREELRKVIYSQENF